MRSSFRLEQWVSPGRHGYGAKVRDPDALVTSPFLHNAMKHRRRLILRAASPLLLLFGFAHADEHVDPGCQGMTGAGDRVQYCQVPNYALLANRGAFEGRKGATFSHLLMEGDGGAELGPMRTQCGGAISSVACRWRQRRLRTMSQSPRCDRARASSWSMESSARGRSMAAASVLCQMRTHRAW